MIPKKQTRLHNPPETIGNCFAAVIASIMEVEVEDVIQIQEYYGDEKWERKLTAWLGVRGWKYKKLDSAAGIKGYYFVTGKYPPMPNEYHICIYKNGKLVHDPHPDNVGILTEDEFSILEKIK